MKLKQFFVGMGGITLISIPFLSYAGTTLNGAGATSNFGGVIQTKFTF